MKKITLYAAVAALLFTACNNNNNSNNRPEIAIPVSVTEITKGGMEKFNTTNGTLVPYGNALVSTLASGKYIPQTNPKTKKFYKIGDLVEKGEVIAILDDQEYVNSISIDIKRINAEIAKGEYEKYVALEKKGGATQTDIRNAEVKVSTTATDYENAKLSLEKMKIVAPISGVIVNLVHFTPGVSVAQGTEVMTVMDYSTMLLDISLSESSMNSVTIGQPVYITHYSMPRDTVNAKVEQLSPAIDAKTRTYKGVISVNNRDLKLKPGMFVKTDIVINSVDSSIVISKDVVKKQGGRTFVFVADGTTAVRKDISTGVENDNYIEVVRGLSVGDKLITEGYETLRDKIKIQIQK